MSENATIYCKSGTSYAQVTLANLYGGIYGEGGRGKHSDFIAFYSSDECDTVRLVPLYDVKYIDIHISDENNTNRYITSLEEDRKILIYALEKMEAMPNDNGMMKAKKIAANALEEIKRK